MTAAPRTAADGHGGGEPLPRPPTDDRVVGRWLWDRLRSSWPLLAVAAAIVAAAVLTATAPEQRLPLSPDSVEDEGTRALVDVLAALERPARVIDPDDLGTVDDGVLLLLRDQLGDGPDGDAHRERLRDRVRRGLRLVVADPSSPLAPDGVATIGLLDRTLTRGCDVAALRDTAEIRPGGGALYEVADDATGCFTTAAGAWLVVTPLGRGHIVALGGPGVLTNAGLRAADNAVLATQLLTPAGSGGPTIVRPVPLAAAPGDGAEGLGDLVPPGVRVMVLQLLVAFVVYVLWRGRRLGRPLPDDAPVRLAGADLTAAVGALLARNTARGAAVRRIADDTRSRVAHRLGLPRMTAVAEVAAEVAARTGRDQRDVATVLTPPDPADDEELLAAAAALAALERAVHTTLSPTTEPVDVR